MPVQLYVVDAIPLTAVGKVFKPALRRDAAERAVRRMLAPIVGDDRALDVAVGSHAEHGTVVSVTLDGAASGERAALERRIHETLDPLPLRHTLAWR